MVEVTYGKVNREIFWSEVKWYKKLPSPTKGQPVSNVSDDIERLDFLEE